MGDQYFRQIQHGRYLIIGQIKKHEPCVIKHNGHSRTRGKCTSHRRVFLHFSSVVNITKSLNDIGVMWRKTLKTWVFYQSELALGPILYYKL